MDLSVLEDRAAGLLARLDARYSKFSNQLPPLLNELAWLKDTFLVSQGNVRFDRVSDLKPVLGGAPWLFWEIFNGLDDEIFLHVAEAGTFYVLASLVIDNLIDRQVQQNDVVILFHQTLLNKGISQFQRLFSSASPFWTHFRRLSGVHLTGLALELELRSDVRQFTIDDVVKIACGKGSPVVTTLAAMTELTGQHDYLKPLETSINNSVVASLLGDDLRDWREDLKAKRLTYFLCSLIPNGAWASNDWPTVEEVEKQIMAKWANVRHLQSMMEWLDRGIDAVGEIECRGWTEYLSYYREIAASQLPFAFAEQIVHGLGDLSESE